VKRPRGDDGTVLVLTLGLSAILLVLVAVVVDVSAVALAQRSVASAADGAAVSAAQGLDETAFYDAGVDSGVPLSDETVAARVAAYAVDAAQEQPGLELSVAVEGGTTARVVARRSVRLPFGGWLERGQLEVTAVARARAPLAPG
jgi:uncharacterized membrane protein